MNHSEVISLFNNRQTDQQTDSDKTLWGYNYVKTNELEGVTFFNQMDLMNHSEVIAISLPTNIWTDKQTELQIILKSPFYQE